MEHLFQQIIQNNTNYHLLGMLVFWGVLLGTNTKLTHMLGFFVLV
jgi:hypothetical protein